MAQHYRTQGIILQKQDVGEADRVFTVFTEDFGKLKLRAVSERKIASKLRSGLDLFYLSNLDFIQGKAHKTVTNAFCLERFPILHGSIERLRLLYRLAEITDELVAGQEKDDKIWHLLQETFSAFERPMLETGDLRAYAYYFLWNLLACTGYAPSLSDIAARDQNTAEFIGVLFRENIVHVRGVDLEKLDERLLRSLSQEHLSKAFEA